MLVHHMHILYLEASQYTLSTPKDYTNLTSMLYNIKKQPNRTQFPEEIILFELALRMIGKEGLSIENIVFGERGLNKTFNMTAVMANDYFDRLDASGYIRVDRTAGLDMIYPAQRLDPLIVIDDYYKNN